MCLPGIFCWRCLLTYCKDTTTATCTSHLALQPSVLLSVNLLQGHNYCNLYIPFGPATIGVTDCHNDCNSHATVIAVCASGLPRGINADAHHIALPHYLTLSPQGTHTHIAAHYFTSWYHQHTTSRQQRQTSMQDQMRLLCLVTVPFAYNS